MNLINVSDRIAIFGARGMAGSAISRALGRGGYKNQLTPSRAELDLLDLQGLLRSDGFLLDENLVSRSKY